MSNLTDVDDKIINEAIKENCKEKDITDKYIAAYFKMVEDLHSAKPNIIPRVTETMDEIIGFISELLEKGYAYEVNGNVYFRVSKVEDYGKLANINIDELDVGARIEENDEKENPLDFALWKNTDKGIKWNAPFGEGRPGWHTECVVMINKNYPEHKIDIHGGGNDLKFPHHVNEMAQSRALYGTDIASYWIHNAMININGEKMSKSLNNFKLAKDLIEEYSGNVIRMALLSAPYRSPVNFTSELLNTSKMELTKIINASKMASTKLQLNNYVSKEVDETIIDSFLNELSDDLNIANAFTVVYDLVKKLNMALRSNDLENTSKYFNTLIEINKILSFDLGLVELTSEDREIYAKWDEAKKAKDFTKADEYRNILMERGIL
jgi:cysteinyl-tRNA synthetase